MLKTPNGLMSVVFVFVLMAGFGLMWLSVAPNHELHTTILQQNRELVDTLKAGQKNLQVSFESLSKSQEVLAEKHEEMTRLLKRLAESAEKSSAKPANNDGATTSPVNDAPHVAGAQNGQS